MGHELKVKMNEYLPLRDVVFNTLREAILKGELRPGERLMEIHLANRLGVSRTPIREAIRMLELEGLVLMIPRKGAEVAGISEQGLRDVLEVRRSLEELAIELACQRMTDDDILELKKTQEEFRRAVRTADADRRLAFDVLATNVDAAARTAAVVIVGVLCGLGGNSLPVDRHDARRLNAHRSATMATVAGRVVVAAAAGTTGQVGLVRRIIRRGANIITHPAAESAIGRSLTV